MYSSHYYSCREYFYFCILSKCLKNMHLKCNTQCITMISKVMISVCFAGLIRIGIN